MSCASYAGKREEYEEVPESQNAPVGSGAFAIPQNYGMSACCAPIQMDVNGVKSDFQRDPTAPKVSPNNSARHIATSCS